METWDAIYSGLEVNRRMVWFGIVIVDGKLVWGGLAGYVINVTGVGWFWFSF